VSDPNIVADGAGMLAPPLEKVVIVFYSQSELCAAIRHVMLRDAATAVIAGIDGGRCWRWNNIFRSSHK